MKGHNRLFKMKSMMQKLAAKYPVPNTISTEAQALLGVPIEIDPSFKIPQSDREWEHFVQTVNASTAETASQTINSAPIRIEQDTIGGTSVRHLVPDTVNDNYNNHILINFHGGGYTMLGGELSALEGIPLALAGGFTVVAVDYRMPPKHPFPAAVDDGVAVYKALLENYPPENIAVFGTSAGGGLAASVCIAGRDQGLPLPAAAVLNTPWSDLEKNGDSYFTNAGVDPLLIGYDYAAGAMAKLYAGDNALNHPLISPVNADFKPGFPPSMLITGTRDLLLSCTVRLHRALRAANIEADLHVFEAMWHGFSAVPEEKIAIAEAVAFITKHFDAEK